MSLHCDANLRWQAHNFESISLLKRDVKNFSVRKVGQGDPAEKVGPAQ